MKLFILGFLLDFLVNTVCVNVIEKSNYTNLEINNSGKK